MTTVVTKGLEGTSNWVDDRIGGARYLRKLANTFGGNLELTLAAYNAGHGLVMKIKRIPRIYETQDYVAKVIRIYRGYQRSARHRKKSVATQ